MLAPVLESPKFPGLWLCPDATVCHCADGRRSIYLRDVDRGQTSRMCMVGVDLEEGQY